MWKETHHQDCGRKVPVLSTEPLVLRIRKPRASALSCWGVCTALICDRLLTLCERHSRVSPTTTYHPQKLLLFQKIIPSYVLLHMGTLLELSDWWHCGRNANEIHMKMWRTGRESLLVPPSPASHSPHLISGQPWGNSFQKRKEQRQEHQAKSQHWILR